MTRICVNKLKKKKVLIWALWVLPKCSRVIEMICHLLLWRCGWCPGAHGAAVDVVLWGMCGGLPPFPLLCCFISYDVWIWFPSLYVCMFRSVYIIPPASHENISIISTNVHFERNTPPISISYLKNIQGPGAFFLTLHIAPDQIQMYFKYKLVILYPF